MLLLVSSTPRSSKLTLLENGHLAGSASVTMAGKMRKVAKEHELASSNRLEECLDGGGNVSSHLCPLGLIVADRRLYAPVAGRRPAS